MSDGVCQSTRVGPFGRGSRHRLLLRGGAVTAFALGFVVVPNVKPAAVGALRTGQTSTQQVAVDTGATLTVNGPFHGFGAEDDNELLWTPANQAAGARGPVTQGPAGASSDFDQVVAPRLKAMHPSFVRKFVSLSWLFPFSPCAHDTASGSTGCPARSSSGYQWDQPSTYAAGDVDPTGHAFYTPDGTAMAALAEDLSVLKADGTAVLLSISFVPGWMNPAVAFDPPTPANGYQAPDEYRHLPGSPIDEVGVAEDNPTVDGATVTDPPHLALYAQDIAWLVTVLRSEGFSNVVGLSMPNEMAHGTLSLATSGDVAAACPGQNRLSAVAGEPLPTLLSIYSDVAAGLVADRTSIGLYGPDLAPCDIELAVRSPLKRLVQFFDYHDYSPETGLPHSEPGNIAQAVDAVRPTGKQVWITEMGDAFNWTCGTTPVPDGDAWAGLAVKAIDAVNGGIGGVSIWDSSELRYDNTANTLAECQQPWGLWGLPGTGIPGARYRLRDSYYLWSDLTSQASEEPSVFPNSCASSCGPLRLAVLGDGAGHTTLVAYNGSDQPRTIALSFDGAAGTAAPASVVGTDPFAGYVVGPTSTPATLGALGDPDVPVSTVQALLSASRTATTLHVVVPAGSAAVYAN